MTKLCKECGRELDESEFYKDNRGKGYLSTLCKECTKNKHKKYYKDNRQKILEREREKDKSEYKRNLGKLYAEKNINSDIFNGVKVCPRCKRELDKHNFSKVITSKDGLSVYCKECKKEKRKEESENEKRNRIEATKKWRLKNADHIKEYNKKYKDEHRDEVRESYKKYKDNNREKINDIQNIYTKRRLKTDELYKFKFQTRNMIRTSLYRRGYKKNSHTEKILGCSFDDAKNHLEETWLNNYGTPYNGEAVHIDHIIPLSTAKTKEDVIRLCHISNLQYLKPEDNLRKRDSLQYELEIL